MQSSIFYVYCSIFETLDNQRREKTETNISRNGVKSLLISLYLELLVFLSDTFCIVEVVLSHQTSK